MTIDERINDPYLTAYAQHLAHAIRNSESQDNEYIRGVYITTKGLLALLQAAVHEHPFVLEHYYNPNNPNPLEEDL